MASASSTVPRAAGAARRRAARRMPESAQWRSSRTSTSGLCWRVSRAARGRRGGCGSARSGAVPAADARKRREDVSELRPDVVVEPVEAPGLEPAEVLVEGVDEDPERHVSARAPSRPPRERDSHARRRARKLLEQARLADPGLSDELDRGRPPRSSSARRRSNAPSSAARPTSWSAAWAIVASFRFTLSGRRREKSGCGIRVARRCQRAPPAARSIHVPNSPHALMEKA